jgi:hypothetical protein
VVTKACLTNLIEVVSKADLINLIEVVTKAGLPPLLSYSQTCCSDDLY